MGLYLKERKCSELEDKTQTFKVGGSRVALDHNPNFSQIFQRKERFHLGTDTKGSKTTKWKLKLIYGMPTMHFLSIPL